MDGNCSLLPPWPFKKWIEKLLFSNFEILRPLENRVFFLLVPKKNLHRLKLSWSYAIEISISIRIKFFQIWFLYFISKRFRETSLNCCAIFRNNKIEKLAMFTLLIGLRIKHDSDSKKVFTFISMSFPNFAEFILWTVPESIQRGQIKNNPNRAKLFHFYKTNNVCFKKN